MGWNGSGVFSRTNGTQTGTDTWQDNEAATGNIESDQHDTHDQDLADGIQACLAKNGENAATANIPMGGFKFTGLGVGSAAGNSLRYEQLAVQGDVGRATADVAAHATTSNLWGAAQNVLTGAAVTFTDIVDAPYAGAITWVKQNAAHVWTDGAVFSVQGDANYTARAGDWVRIYATTVSTFEVTVYRADGTATGGTGAIIQSGYAEYLTHGSTATAMPTDDTIPQNTEGVELITLAITPKSTANKVRVRFVVNCSSNAIANVNAAIFKDSVANALRAWTAVIDTIDYGRQIVGEYEDSPASVSAVTYKLRIGPNANTMYLNGSSASRQFGGVAGCTLTVEELKV